MNIVGIDASTNKTGVAFFQNGKYIEHTLIDLHSIKNPDKRIPKMMLAICEHLDKYQIDKIIMEKSMLKSNIDTVQKLSNLAGAIMYYAARNDIEFEFAYPTEWRRKIGLQQSFKIKRDILKEEAIEAVRQAYGIEVTDDEAEAILLARSGYDLPKIFITEDDLWEI